MDNLTTKTTIRYDKTLLYKICKDNNIELRQSYDYVTSETHIYAKCAVENCNANMVKKTFRDFVKYANYGCIEHSKSIALDRRKATNVKICGYEFFASTIESKNKTKETNMKLYGYDTPSKVPKFKDKGIETNLIKYGCKHAMQNPDIRQKVINTNLERYGCENSFENPEVKQKIKDTNISRHGYECSFHNPETQEKIKDTNMKIYGYENVLLSPIIQAQIKDTNMKIYGHENVLLSPIIQAQIKETTMRIYGVEHVMHDPIIAQRASDNAYKFKDYIFPSGRVERIQGYENRGLDDLLLEAVHENDIITNRTKVPEIWWTDIDNKKHRYYVDIFIVSQKRCIEVKSTWTFEKKKDIVFLKQQAVKDAGYECEIWIYDNKKLIEKYY
jgi:hypothetical protein